MGVFSVLSAPRSSASRFFAYRLAVRRLRPERVDSALLVLLALLLAGALGEPRSAAAQDTPEVTAFVGVSVLPMTEPMTSEDPEVLADRTVLVRGDRIAEVGPAGSVEVPDGARRIDGSGRYLMPGMAELHGHVPNPEERPQYTRDVLWLFLSNGVTTVRGMLGHPGQLELRAQVNAGEVPGPTLYLAGPPFTGGSVEGPEDAERMVREQAEAGWDYLKVLEGMNLEEYRAMASTAREEGIPFIGHVPNGVGLEPVLESGQETIDHLDGYISYLDGGERDIPQEELASVVRRTREAGIAVVPTMALWEVLMGATPTDVLNRYSELRFMPPGMVENWIDTQRRRRASDGFDPERAERIIENRTRLLRTFYEQEASILFGTDAPQQFSVPGFSIHREIPHMEEAGMSPYAILVSATAAPGRYFAEKDAFGTVEAGQRADLVLLERNPLEDLANLQDPAGVMSRGQWHSRSALRAELERIAESHGQSEGGDWGQF